MAEDPMILAADVVISRYCRPGDLSSPGFLSRDHSAAHSTFAQWQSKRREKTETAHATQASSFTL